MKTRLTIACLLVFCVLLSAANSCSGGASTPANSTTIESKTSTSTSVPSTATSVVTSTSSTTLSPTTSIYSTTTQVFVTSTSTTTKIPTTTTSTTSTTTKTPTSTPSTTTSTTTIVSVKWESDQANTGLMTSKYLKFTVQGNKIVSLTISVFPEPEEWVLWINDDPILIKDNKFTFTLPSGDNNGKDMVLEGTFVSATECRGTMTFPRGFFWVDFAMKNDLTITWTAHPK
jgi:hypothetical protein